MYNLAYFKHLIEYRQDFYDFLDKKTAWR